MSYREIVLEKEGQIALITLNRPEKLNAYTRLMAKEIRDALEEVEDDPELRVTIMTGAGRGFCAGMDLSGGGSTFDSSDNPETAESSQPASFLKYCFSLKKPVIVAYNGPAVGVGVTMTLPYDIRIAGESARISLAFNRRGVLPEIGCPWILPRIIGVSRAAELMYTGRMLSAREALEYGLVSQVVPDDQLMSTAREMANDIAVNCAPVSVALTKHMLYQFLMENDVEKAERINHLYFAWSGKQADSREGVESFLEKRPPKWNLKVPGDLPDFFPLD